MTGFTAKGESLIYYVLTFECNLRTILDMNVFDFISFIILTDHNFKNRITVQTYVD